MAVNDAATLVVNSGNYFTAPYVESDVADLPADLMAIGTPWSAIGHTSLDEILTITSEGGEETVIGTLQKRSLRTTRADRTETFNITLQQWDEAGLKLYYGSNATVGVDGLLQIPQSPVPTIASFLAVFYDGDQAFAIYCPKAEIFRGDDVSIPDTDSLASLPLSIRPMTHGSNTWAYGLLPLGS